MKFLKDQGYALGPPSVLNLLDHEPGEFVVLVLEYPIVHKLRGNGVCRNGAFVRMCRPAGELVNCLPCFAAG